REGTQRATGEQPSAVRRQGHSSFCLQRDRCSIPALCGGDAVRSGLLAVLLAGAAGARAGAPAPPSPARAETVVLKAARLFDGRGDATIRDGVVVVEGGKIKAAGSGLPVPAGARVVELGDATLLPGFIDAHVHLTGESSDDWYSAAVEGLRRTVAEKAIRATEFARRTLMAGFTTVRNVGANDFID